MAFSLIRVYHGYYITNALLLFLYPLIRRYFHHNAHPAYTRLSNATELNQWEYQACGLLLVTVVLKGIRSRSFEEFLSNFFLYAKTVLALLSFLIDLRIFAYYCLLNILIFMTWPQPEYTGPDKIESLTPILLRQHIRESKDSGITWLVEFYAPWSATSIHLEPVFAEISLKYRTDKLHFAKIDLSKWPGIDREFHIDANSSSKQVPSFILFSNGNEIGRIPYVSSDGSISSKRYTKVDMIKAFELDMRYATSFA